MAKTRYLKDSFWTDGYVENLDPIEKLLYIYLITNPYVELCGVYELPLKRMSYETGIDRDMIERILDRFQERGKIIFHDGWIRLINFTKHQSATSPKIKSAIDRGMQSIPRVLIPYLYPIDTPGYPISTYTLTYRDNLDLEESNLNSNLTDQPIPNGDDAENFDSENNSSDLSLNNPTKEKEKSSAKKEKETIPLKRIGSVGSIINKNNRNQGIMIYNVIKYRATIVDGTLDDCVVLYSKLSKLGDDPVQTLEHIIDAMVSTGQDQFYSISSPSKLAYNLGTIYNKLKSSLSKPKVVDLSSHSVVPGMQ